MSQAHEGQRMEARAVREDQAETESESPHERAMDRHDLAIEALNAAEQHARAIVSAAEREVGEALADLVRYEKKPGVALPLAEQRRIEDSTVVNRRREMRGEDR